jgi:SEC-C motif
VTAGRNDPCPCGSGLKYKRCCAVADAARESVLIRRRNAGTAAARIRADLLYDGCPDDFDVVAAWGLIAVMARQAAAVFDQFPGAR